MAGSHLCDALLLGKTKSGLLVETGRYPRSTWTQREVRLPSKLRGVKLASKLQAEMPSTAAARMIIRRVVITLIILRRFC